MVGLRLGYAEFTNANVDCLKPLEVTYKPSFAGEKLTSIKLDCDEPWNFTFPIYLDFDGKPAKIKVSLYKTDEFLFFDEITYAFTIINDLKKHIGFYKFQYTLIDNHDESEEFSVDVLVTCENNYKISVPIFHLDPPKPFIKWINQMGKVRVGFTRSIMIPNYDSYPEFKEEENMR